ncbi:hypothetical protein MASR2M18_09680 [Ignavibacteria bacterium]|nr:hypothetical protein [Bacteroidota bacterium]MCZ2131716.1 hypothetical protein [Bacteroidota bacterium]
MKPREAYIRSIALWIAAIFAVAAVGCKTADSLSGESDDAVRIKPDAQRSYEKAPVTGAVRSGRTLRGKVIEMRIEPNTVNSNKTDTVIIFLAAGSKNEPEYYEEIPYSDIEPVGRMFNMPLNKYGNINYFEGYNITGEVRGLREVPVRISGLLGGAGGGAGYNPEQDCGCEPFGLEMPNVSLKCPERDYSLVFVEMRAVYTMFSDKPAPFIESGRTGWEGEIATGFRFGANREWGAGVSYSTGTAVFNSTNATEAARPSALLHLRYSLGRRPFELLGFCARPFFYANGGIALDKATMNLVKMNLSPDSCSSCNALLKNLSASGQLPEADFSMPVSFGFGAGLDIPIFSWLDASADIGWRSLAIADEIPLAGFTNVPSNRRVNMLRLRFGLTF